MEIVPKLVDSVDAIKIWIEHGEISSTLAISAEGHVESSNFANPELHYVETSNPIPDGIHPHDVYEFQFFATPPQVGETYYMEKSPVTAVFKWNDYSKNMKVIRIIHAGGLTEEWVELGGPGTPFEEGQDQNQQQGNNQSTNQHQSGGTIDADTNPEF